MHSESHPLAGQNITLPSGDTYWLEDWWDRVSGGTSWMDMQGNPACMLYAMKSGMNNLPLDNEVVYGKVDGLGHLMHVSELGLDNAGKS